MTGQDREDLRALDDDALARLASPGLVKRARRERAEAEARVRVEAGALIGEVGAHRVVVAAGAGLEGATCTCGARALCRHALIAVMALRDATREAHDPPDADPASEAAALPPADAIEPRVLREHLGTLTMRRAARARDAGLVATVRRTGGLSVSLPAATVRFLVPGDLAYARCDCRARPPCLHLALATWSLEEARRIAPDAGSVEVALGPPPTVAAGALDEARALAEELLLGGADHAGPELAGRFGLARRALEDAGLRWPLDACAELERALSAYHARGGEHRVEAVGALLTELHARGRAARSTDGAIREGALGAREPAETALAELRLVSLGARVRRVTDEDGDARAEVEVFFVDPGAPGAFVLRRAWPVSPDERGPQLARRAALRGVTLGALAAGQVVTRIARRRADRGLELGPGARGDTSVTPQRGAWGTLHPGLLPPSVDAALAELRARPPRLVRPRVLADAVRVIAVRRVRDLTYDPAERTLTAELEAECGGHVTLTLERRPGREEAAHAAVDALRREPRFVSGAVRRDGAALTLDPLAIVTDRVVVLDLEPAGDARLPARAAPRPADPIEAALRDARRALDDAAHHGLRHLSPAWRDGAGAIADRLADLGLATTAARLRAVGAARSAEAWLEASTRIRLALEA